MSQFQESFGKHMTFSSACQKDRNRPVFPGPGSTPDWKRDQWLGKQRRTSSMHQDFYLGSGFNNTRNLFVDTQRLWITWIQEGNRWYAKKIQSSFNTLRKWLIKDSLGVQHDGWLQNCILGGDNQQGQTQMRLVSPFQTNWKSNHQSGPRAD